MPVLGSGGRVLFKRPPLNTIEVEPENFNSGCSSFNVNSSGIWNGDKICITDITLEGELPANTGAFATYLGSKFALGPNRDHIDSNSDNFYKNDSECYPDNACGDAANFYAVNGVGEVPEAGNERCFFVNIDEFGRLRLFNDRCSAIAGCAGNEVKLANFPLLESLLLETLGTREYRNAKWECIFDGCQVPRGDYGFSDVADSETDVSICASAPLFDFPVAGTDEYDNADVQPRGSSDFPQALCNLREYSLNLDAPAIDTTLVGEKFGDNIKSLVRGGGSFEFFIDRNCLGEDTEDASWMLLNLLTLTEGGCTNQPIETEAWFYLYEQDCTASNCFPPIGGSLYYKANILITQAAVNVRPTELIAGTAEFVTTGEIKLLQAS